ncbi:MAG: molybdopterin-binding protein, partial [Actinomycetota bacterium]|nr:molybdopterin-binding protein [Actinomycetota bacterium]
DRRALTEAFEGALSHADMLVTSGGVSAGRYDLVKQVLAQLGDVAFSKVGMQPGMPQAFGFVTRPLSHPVPCFGLPGNPVSAFVSFEVFVRPALRRLQGRTDLNRPRVNAVLDESFHSPAHKVSFLRVTLRRDDDVWYARATGPQGSGILSSAVEADGLAEIPSHRTEVAAGETVVVHLLVSR